MRSGRTRLVAVSLGVLLGASSPGRATVVDRVVGAVAPNGGAQLVKRFSVPAGSVIVGIEFMSNDLRTVFPKVALLQGTLERTSEAAALAEVQNVRPGLRHRVQVAVPAVTVSKSQDLYVAVTLPASDGVEAVTNGPALVATQLREPNGSFLASPTDGTLQAIDVDLSIELLMRTVGKADAPRGDEKALTETFLSGGTPNPATSAVRVQFRFGLERGMPVKLAVYNVAGRLVRLLAEGPMDAGVHAADWDAKDERGQSVAEGVYIAKLRAGEKILTQKLVLTR